MKDTRAAKASEKPGAYSMAPELACAQILGFLISHGPCTLRALPLRPRAALAPMLDLIQLGYVRSAEGADAALVFAATPKGERAEVRWRRPAEVDDREPAGIVSNTWEHRP